MTPAEKLARTAAHAATGGAGIPSGAKISPGRAEAYDKLCARLWPRGARSSIWAVLDGARDEQVWWTIKGSSLEHGCLYAGALSSQLERAAPHLVQLEFDERNTRQLVNRGWGRSWGIFLQTNATLKALQRHLRHFLLVGGPGGKQLLFRYYDPRVMRAFLPTCTVSQLNELFGPIERIMTEGAKAGQMMEFRLDEGKEKLVSSCIELG